MVAQPYEHASAAYFTLLFRTDACKSDTVSRSRGIVDDRNRLYWDGFKDLRVPVPAIAEQDVIVEAITEQTYTIGQAVVRVGREIELLREYRTRLVADVVTGKLDVREAAGHLPEEPGPNAGEDVADKSEEPDPAEEGAEA